MSEERVPSDRMTICSQLLRQQERAHQLLEEIRAEIGTPITHSMLERIRGEVTHDIEDGVAAVLAKLEDALGAIRYCESEIHRELLSPRGENPAPDGPDNLPAGLARFLVERKDTPGFTYEVRQDPVRGWIVHWKEYASSGTVRGSGQFYELPYAWLES